jgi:hypothetical protein
VSGVDVDTNGVITATVATAVGAAAAAGTACTITFTPTVGNTALKWAVAASGCTTVISNIVAKWN